MVCLRLLSMGTISSPLTPGLGLLPTQISAFSRLLLLFQTLHRIIEYSNWVTTLTAWRLPVDLVVGPGASMEGMKFTAL